MGAKQPKNLAAGTKPKKQPGVCLDHAPPTPTPRRTPRPQGRPDNGAMWRAQQGSGYGGSGRRKAQPEPKPDIDPRDGRDHKGQYAEGNGGIPCLRTLRMARNRTIP